MTAVRFPETIVPNPLLRKQVEEKSGEKVSACFQCEKCTNGCPLAFCMDILPHKLMRFVHLGLKDEILDSDSIWICASCQTCTTRCPNGIDIAHVMDTLRQIGQREGIKASQHNVPIFHSAFLSSIRRHGRVHETEMAITYSIGDVGLSGLLNQAGMGFSMFIRGKLKLKPSRIRAIGHVRNIFKKTEGKV
jgi:heterodisulfide reductase subunit C